MGMNGEKTANKKYQAVMKELYEDDREAYDIIHRHEQYLRRKINKILVQLQIFKGAR